MSSRGVIAVVVGPSGAGKDSLIDFARAHLQDDDGFEFVRRVITREEGAVGEEHAAVSEHAFGEMERDGAFALHWRAHGLSYGIPFSTRASLQNGRILIANGSRSALPAFSDVYGDSLRVVLVTAPKEILAARLAARGREDEASIRKRLDRSVDVDSGFRADVTIVNDGTLDQAGLEFVDALKAFVAEKETPHSGYRVG
jgi:ribose 1,5-bisphosphokinase